MNRVKNFASARHCSGNQSFPPDRARRKVFTTDFWVGFWFPVISVNHFKPLIIEFFWKTKKYNSWVTWFWVAVFYTTILRSHFKQTELLYSSCISTETECTQLVSDVKKINKREFKIKKKLVYYKFYDWRNNKYVDNLEKYFFLHLPYPFQLEFNNNPLHDSFKVRRQLVLKTCFYTLT